MKKVMLLLAVAGMFAFASCGEKKATEETPATPATETPAPEAAQAPAEETAAPAADQAATPATETPAPATK